MLYTKICIYLFVSVIGNCLAHKTAVGSGALVMYLRYLCRPDAKEIFLNKPAVRSTLLLVQQSAKPVLHPPRASLDVHGQSNPGEAKADSKISDVNRSKLAILTKDLKVENYNVGNVNIDGNIDSVKNIKLNEVDVQVTDNNNQLAINNNIPKYDNEYGNKDENGDDIDLAVNKVELGNMNNDYEDEDEDYDENGDDGADDDEDEDDDEYDNDLGNYPINRDDAGDDLGQYDDGGNNVEDDDYDGEDDDGIDKGLDNISPHIHARNMGNAQSKDFEGKLKDSEKIHPVKDYDDDEEVDDYAYDDDDDDDDEDEETEKHHQDDLKDDNALDKRKQGTSHLLIDLTKQNTSLSYSPFFIMSAICIIVVFILWRCLRKRRLRLRVGHKYFHV